METLERLQTLLMLYYPLPREALTREAVLHELGIDSLGAIEMFFAIEDEFNLVVPNDKKAIQTVGDVVDYVDELIAEQHDTASIRKPDMAVSYAVAEPPGAA